MAAFCASIKAKLVRSETLRVDVSLRTEHAHHQRFFGHLQRKDADHRACLNGCVLRQHQSEAGQIGNAARRCFLANRACASPALLWTSPEKRCRPPRLSEWLRSAPASKRSWSDRKRCASMFPCEQSMRITSASLDISREKMPTTAPV